MKKFAEEVKSEIDALFGLAVTVAVTNCTKQYGPLHGLFIPSSLAVGELVVHQECIISSIHYTKPLVSPVANVVCDYEPGDETEKAASKGRGLESSSAG